MNLKHQELDIPKDKPFENCKLDRERFADVLTDIVLRYADGFVLAVNNEWGAGKTTFLNMWRQSLINKEYHTLYYNAWENDFEKDVLVALVSELEELKKCESSSTVDKAYKSVVKKAALLTKKVGPGIIRAAFKRYADIEAEELLNIINGTSEVALETLQAEIKAYSNRKDGLKDFKENLQNLVEKVSKDKPVVFFIDELDRCRPNYAVEVLEVVKHLFSVPGIVFVLSIDKEQLEHSIRGVYGSDLIKAEEYLKRFIDLEYSLPEPNAVQMSEYLYEYFSFKDFIEEENRAGSSSFRNDKINLINFSSLLISSQKINFRQAEKIYANARVALMSFNYNNYLFPPLFIFLIFLKTFKPKTYKNIRVKKYSPQELVNEVEVYLQGMTSSSNGKSYSLSIIVQLTQFYHNYQLEEVYSPMKLTFQPEEKGLQDYIFITSKLDNSGQNKELKRAAQLTDDLYYSPGVKISYLLDKIDLLENINFI